jgi:hypothetical protein
MKKMILILSLLLGMSSCSKDELIPNKITSKIKQTEVKSKDTLKSKKKKFKLFRKKKCKVSQVSQQIS